MNKKDQLLFNFICHKQLKRMSYTVEEYQYWSPIVWSAIINICTDAVSAGCRKLKNMVFKKKVIKVMEIKKPRFSSEPWISNSNLLPVLDSSIAEILTAVHPSMRSWFSGYISTHKERLTQDIQFISQDVPLGKKILDVGCIPPITITTLSKLGFDVEGVDIEPDRCGDLFRNNGIKAIKCNIENEKIDRVDHYFDVVIFFEIFEHLRINPIKTMSEIKRVLKKDGLLLLSTPNLRSLKGLSNFLIRGEAHSACSGVYEQYESLDALGHMGHVREYTTKEIIDFLFKCNFSVERVYRRGKYTKYFPNIISRALPGLRPFNMYYCRNL